MKILFTRFPLESALGGAEVQTLTLMEGLIARGHSVAFAGSCPVLLEECRKRNIMAVEWHVGPPPVTKWGVISFAWKQAGMKRKLKLLLDQFHDLDAIAMLSLTEKLLLTDVAAAKGIKTIWIEHDTVGRWLTQNPWLPRLIEQSRKATTVGVSELSKKTYLALGWNEALTVAVPNGITPPSPGPFPQGGRGDVDQDNGWSHKPIIRSVLANARAMRKKPTEAEDRLWQELRFDQLGVRFRRQHPVEGKIIDFFCHEGRMGIEVDGDIHLQKDQREYDAYREELLSLKGIRLIRFTNEDVLHDTTSVVRRIKEELKKNTPLPRGGGAGGGGLRLLCVARLSPEKGVDVLLDAIKDLPDMTLDIIGDGQSDAELKEIAKPLGGRVRFLGRRNDVRSLYVNYDALVLPSREHDPFGLVAAEAMMAGIPAIVTDACGIADYLTNGKDALVARADDTDSLKRAIGVLTDNTAKDRIAEEGKKTAEDRFSAQRMVDEYEKLFKM